ncbi:MAG TPA: bifunctional phosphoglucose/phosphomannose isomerase [Actinomycetota bacterium]|jgi:glucose/mannose-6-phosphate isomerase
MTDIDDLTAVSVADPGHMLDHIASLGAQLRAGYAAGVGAAGLPSGDGIRSIVVCGMGGSGVAGDVLRVLMAPRLPLPVLVCKGYDVPAACGPDTLVLAVSFSGDTEETVSAYASAAERGCRMVAISRGGRLEALARRDGAARVGVDVEAPMPRQALGFLGAAPLGVLEAIGLLPSPSREVGEAAAAVDALAERLGPGRRLAVNEAKDLARWLGERTPVVWGSEGPAETAAARWKTQMNENAKIPAFASWLPELDHNEIEGWSRGTGGPFALVVLRHAGEPPRIGDRVEATLAAIKDAGLESRQVWADDAVDSDLARLFTLILLGDFVSAYVAILRGTDPSPIPVLSGLKDLLRT